MKIMSSFLFIFLLTTQAFAEGECYTQEINPHTKKVYVSKEQYDMHKQEWTTIAPESPGLFALAKAYRIYSREKDFANKLRNDKRAHCYIGCRLSQEMDYRVAEYVGWLKEDRDIKDCNKATHFDSADYKATRSGATFGESQPDAKGCVAVCKANY